MHINDPSAKFREIQNMGKFPEIVTDRKQIQNLAKINVETAKYGFLWLQSCHFFQWFAG